VTGSVPERKSGSVPERKSGSVPERKAGSVPERKAGSVPEREAGDPVPIGDALAKVRDELGLPEVDTLRALSEHWADIVGADVAAHAQLRAVRDGVVTIAADSSLWASQFRYLERAFVERANGLVGEDAITSVRVRVEPG
jgi:predicted nucleic acid-binding Zn ribbon protein